MQENRLIGHICIDGNENKDEYVRLLQQSDQLEYIDSVALTVEGFETLYAMGQRSLPTGDPSRPPRIVSVYPPIGSSDVDHALRELSVTFDQDMADGFSWTGGGPFYPESTEGQRPYWRDKRTCILPVTLEAGHFYRVGINAAPRFMSFRSVHDKPVTPTEMYFTTQGADAETLARMVAPRIVSLSPPNGALDVDPALTELRVTFDKPMGGGFSWTGGGPNYPERPEGKRPYWSDDKMTCHLPVTLKPDWEYHLGLNSASYHSFRAEGGIAFEPVRYNFKTAGQSKAHDAHQ